VWPTSIGFASAVPAVAPGHYTATLTFTVIGR
jgi:type 1 fimbria pilin